MRRFSVVALFCAVAFCAAAQGAARESREYLSFLPAEGLEGGPVVEAPDWRLFLWSGSEVAHALGELSQKRWIRHHDGRVLLDLYSHGPSR